MRLLDATVIALIVTGQTVGRAEPYKYNASKFQSALDKKDGPRLSLSWVRTLQSRISSCWLPPSGLTSSDINIRVTLELSTDGSITAGPTIIEATTHPMGPAFAESVVAALKRCQPYS